MNGFLNKLQAEYVLDRKG